MLDQTAKNTGGRSNDRPLFVYRKIPDILRISGCNKTLPVITAGLLFTEKPPDSLGVRKSFSGVIMKKLRVRIEKRLPTANLETRRNIK